MNNQPKVSFLSPDLRRQIVVLFIKGVRSLSQNSDGDLCACMPDGTTPPIVKRDWCKSDGVFEHVAREVSEYFSILVEHEIDQLINLADSIWFNKRLKSPEER